MCTNGEVNAKVVEQGDISNQAILNKPPPDNDDDKCSKVDCLPCTSGQTKLKSYHRGAVGELAMNIGVCSAWKKVKLLCTMGKPAEHCTQGPENMPMG